MDEPPVSVEFRGVTYRRNPNGQQRAHRVYYLAPRGSGRDYLHRDIWRHHHPGEIIPDGWHVHHEDDDPFNNDPANLVPLSHGEHMREHAGECSDRQREHLDTIRHLAVEWHRSPEGIAWHREHGKRSWDNREPLEQRQCVECGEDFEAWASRSRYCSRKCIARAHRRSGRYLETATCPQCGETFTRSRHTKRPETCGRRCAGALRRDRTQQSVRVCQECGAAFHPAHHSAKYCSRRCGAAANQREAKADGRYREWGTCVVCGNGHERSKYTGLPETCGRRCGAVLGNRRAARRL